MAALAAAAVPLAAAPAAVARPPGLAAAVTVVKRHGYTPDTTRWWIGSRGLNAIVATATRSGDGYAHRAFFFQNGRYLGTDAGLPSRQIIQLWGDGETVALLYVLYRPSDPNCCPTGGGAIVRFHWNGRRLVALDRIPSADGRVRLSR